MKRVIILKEGDYNCYLGEQIESFLIKNCIYDKDDVLKLPKREGVLIIEFIKKNELKNS
jgi:hypothetical protein